MSRVLLALVGLLVLAVPARAADEVLGPLHGAARLSAYGGWVVFSQPTGAGAWTLKTWHDGVVADVGVAASDAPFDVDVGPDTSGLPTVVYSRCGAPPKADAPPGDCDLFAVGLGGGAERRLGVSTSRDSEFAPAIWRNTLAFGRRSPKQRKADISLHSAARSCGASGRAHSRRASRRNVASSHPRPGPG